MENGTKEKNNFDKENDNSSKKSIEETNLINKELEEKENLNKNIPDQKKWKL